MSRRRLRYYHVYKRSKKNKKKKKARSAVQSQTQDKEQIVFIPLSSPGLSIPGFLKTGEPNRLRGGDNYTAGLSPSSADIAVDSEPPFNPYVLYTYHSHHNSSPRTSPYFLLNPPKLDSAGEYRGEVSSESLVDYVDYSRRISSDVEVKENIWNKSQQKQNLTDIGPNLSH
ncbi:uncharacterized protein C8R40DRAFT_1073696 [Lentinula edodes]|uniref:uncharacterized protein n=1 Tax=Lentinula edodes TaxID=5353 RepID=UPI001E8D3C4D|nr:uncharacterized protein C8R40DRAFT_1073696 [Lentinula edodes]KAH7869894.1 hypothetical protein C8R40DRAFT_1073696 [Lentinula edodes]